MSAVPSRMVIDIPATEQARLQKQLRGARWGGWLTLHILLLLAQQRSPPDIARWLLCSRSTVYAAAQAWQLGRRPWETGSGLASARLPPGLTPARQRSLLTLLKVPYALELRGSGRNPGAATRLARVGRNRPALVARLGLALETSPTGSQRQ